MSLRLCHTLHKQPYTLCLCEVMVSAVMKNTTVKNVFEGSHTLCKELHGK
jgi:hypothetical protein